MPTAAEETNDNALQAVSPNAGARLMILRAAAWCFMQNGFSATSIDDVARSLSATKGMIYHHFRSKIDLFFEVYRMGMDINFAATKPHIEGPGTALERLTKMGLAHAIALMKEQPFQRVLSLGVAMHQQGSTTAAQRETLDELIAIRGDYEALFRTTIETAAKEENLEIGDASLATKSFLAVLNGVVFWYSPRDADGADEWLSLGCELVRYALRGLGADMPHGAVQAIGRQTDPTKNRMTQEIVENE